MRALLAAATLSLLGALTACEPAVIDHSPTSNLFDPDSASLEAGLGDWSGWFSADVSRHADAARVGEAGLLVEVTAPYGWGVHLDNWPGLPASPGRHHASYWVRTVRGTSQAIELRFTWRDANGEELQSEAFTGPLLTSDWVRSTHELTAPEGTERVGVDVTGSEGEPGDVLALDAFVLLPALTP